MKNWPTWELKENAHGGNTFGTFSTTNQTGRHPQGKLLAAKATAGPTEGNFVLEHNAQNSKERKRRDKLKLYLSPMFIHWNSSHPRMLNT